MIQTTKTLDWDKYLKTAAQVVSEGIVMLKNEHQALPLKPHEEIIIKAVPAPAAWLMFPR